MNLRKKAVSPLIATVLLVMITVSIGAAIMVVIQGISDTQLSSIAKNQQLIQCGNDIKAQIFKIGDVSRVCYSTNQTHTRFAFVLDNTGFVDINDFKVTLVGNTSIQEIDGGFSSLEKGEKHGYGVSAAVTGLEAILISPMVASGTSSVVTCRLSNLEWDSVGLDTLSDCNSTSVSWDNSLTLS